jgi:hypothetical protein
VVTVGVESTYGYRRERVLRLVTEVSGMGRLWVRTVLVLVGSAVLAVYTAGAIGGLLLFHGLSKEQAIPWL